MKLKLIAPVVVAAVLAVGMFGCDGVQGSDSGSNSTSNSASESSSSPSNSEKTTREEEEEEKSRFEKSLETAIAKAAPSWTSGVDSISLDIANCDLSASTRTFNDGSHIIEVTGEASGIAYLNDKYGDVIGRVKWEAEADSRLKDGWKVKCVEGDYF